MKFSNFNVELLSNNSNETIIFNTLLRSSIVIEKQCLNELKQSATFINSNVQSFAYHFNNYNDLIEHGFIIDNNIDEYLLFKYWYKKEKYKNNLCTVTLLTTFRCNLKCSYCFEGSSVTKNSNMSFEISEKALNFIKTLLIQSYSKTLDLNFFGGEPLLNFPIIEETMNALNDFGKKNKIEIKANIVTNGVLLKESYLKKLSALNISTLQITLDGVKAEHNNRRPFPNGEGSFDTVYKNLIKSIKHGFEVILNINYDEFNFCSIESFLKDFPPQYRTNIFISFSPIKVTGKNREKVHQIPNDEVANIWFKLNKLLIDYKYNVNDLEKNEYGPCTYLRKNFITIDPYGNVGKCIYGIGDNKYLAGNLNENHEYIVQNIATFTSTEPCFNNECKSCKYLPLCMGGCRRECLETLGSNKGIICKKTNIKEGFIKTLTYYYNNLL